MQQESAPRHPVVVFQFALANLAASQTGTDIPIPGGVVPTYLMPNAGYIVGYSINKSAAHTAGSLDFDLEIGGTSTLTIAADTSSVYGKLNVPDEPFAAGDALGVTYTSDANLDATTVDVVVSVFVVFENFDF